MIYSSPWEFKKLEEMIIFNPEENILPGDAVKLINMNELKPGHKHISDFVSAEYMGKGRKFRNGDVLVPQISSALAAGKTALVSLLDKDEIGVGSNWFIVLRSIDGISSPDFLYYLAITPWFRELALKAREGATQSQYVNINILKEIALPFPPYEEQCLIADTLSLIDEKIKKNSEVFDAAEKILAELFYIWFIEFNFPDKEGKPYASNGGKFIGSELGLIPRGWKTGRLSDVGDIAAGATPSKKIDKYYSDKGIPWITPRDLSNQGTKFVSRGEVDITWEGHKSCSVVTMPAGTVLFSSRAPIGYMAIADNELTTSQGFRSVIPHKGVGSNFVYYLLRSKTQDITNIASGSIFKEISGQALKDFEIIIPDALVLKAFEEQTEHISRYQRNLEKENRLLTLIRKNLLPVLMTGIKRIPARGLNKWMQPKN